MWFEFYSLKMALNILHLQRNYLCLVTMTSEIDPALLALSGSKIEIIISCNNLADLDEFTKTDPMCVMSIKQFGQWKEYGRTEAIRNTLNPRVSKRQI